MNPSEAAELLAVASALDPRLRPPSAEDAKARAVLWSQTLDDDMPLQAARTMVGWHYKESTDGVMPAHVNRLWRQHRRTRAEAERASIQRKEITDMAAMSVPMPPEIREQLRKALDGTKTS